MISSLHSRNFVCMGGWGGGVGWYRLPMENHKAEGFLSNTVPDLLKNRKATKPAFNVGPSLARQRNAINWRFSGGSMMGGF